MQKHAIFLKKKTKRNEKQSGSAWKVAYLCLMENIKIITCICIIMTCCRVSIKEEKTTNTYLRVYSRHEISARKKKRKKVAKNWTNKKHTNFMVRQFKKNIDKSVTMKSTSFFSLFVLPFIFFFAICFLLQNSVEDSQRDDCWRLSRKSKQKMALIKKKEPQN